LLENFYTMSYSDAMSRVHTSYEIAKRAYFERQRNAEIERIEKVLDTAVRTGMDQMIVDKLKMQLGEKLLESVVNGTVDDKNLRRDFLETGLGIQPAPHLLPGSGTAQKALPDR
jgi:hypothetical protein